MNNLSDASKIRLSPIKSIRAKCLDCCANQRKIVATCHITGCPLHAYRMGTRPQTYQKVLDRRAVVKNNEI